MARRTRNAAARTRPRKAPAEKRAPKAAKPSAERATSPALRRLDEAFEERRYEPAASGRQYLGVVLMSLGAIALGAGFFAVFLRADDAPPLDWAPWLLAAGAVLLVVHFILGQAAQPVVRVGELGIAVEEGERLARTAWFQIERISFDGANLTVKPPLAALVLPLSAHGPAAQRIVAEALVRIPDRTEIDEGELGVIEAAKGESGERVLAEPPQVTDMQCAASARPLTFERDVRMCGRCGVFYHRAAVPLRCIECSRKLRKAA